MELDLGFYLGLGLRLSQNRAQSRPPPSPLMIAKSLFLSFFFINDGASGSGYFVGVGLLTGSVGLVTDWWGGSLVWSARWWGGGGLIVLVSGGGIWVLFWV